MEKKPSERINELFREEEKRLSSVANFANAIMNYLDEEYEKKQEEVATAYKNPTISTEIG